MGLLPDLTRGFELMQQVLDSLRRIEVTLQNIHNKLIDIDSNTKPRSTPILVESKEELNSKLSKARNAKPLPPLGNRDF